MLLLDNGYSPLLSLATAAYEIALAARALRSPGRPAVRRPIAALLLLLAGYQLLEAVACGRTAEAIWVRLAYADVVWLPPLSLWLLVRYTRPAPWARRLVLGSFGAAAGLVVLVFALPDFVTGTVCQAVVATYGRGTPWFHLYGGLYELGLFTTVFWGIAALARLGDPTARAHVADLVAGTAAFMLLAFLTQVVASRWIDPSLPSLMCHYALVLAVLLGRTIRREAAR